MLTEKELTDSAPAYKRFVPVIELLQLNHGDIVRSKATGQTYTVLSNYGSHVTAVKSADITNPGEWEIFR